MQKFSRKKLLIIQLIVILFNHSIYFFYNLFTPSLNKNNWLPTLYTRHILGLGNKAVNKRKLYFIGSLISKEK